MRVVVSGSSGLIATALLERLRNEGHEPVRLVRRPAAGDGEISWDPAAGRIDTASLEGADAVVHLAGAGIGDKRWTAAHRQLILSSRQSGTSLLASTLAALTRRPRVFLSGSAIGYYGDRGDEVLSESSAPGDGFLSEVCQVWEAATAPAASAGIRTVCLRTGIVLSAKGGALRKQLLLFRLGLGGRMGSGRQWTSWITLDDEVRAIVHLLGSSLAGPVNLVAPEPATNAQFARSLGRALKRPAVLPVPKFAPRLLLGREMADELLFASQRVVPAKLEADGFTFEANHLDDAWAFALRRH